MGPDVIQRESERQFYLGMAGIRMWYARDSLPGAAPSPDYDFGAEEQAPADATAETLPVAPQVRPADPEQASRNRDKIARLQSLMEPSAPKRPPVPKESSSQPVSPARTAPAAAQPDTPAAPVDSVDAEPEVPESVSATTDVPRLSLKVWAGKRLALVAEISGDSSLALQEALARNILRSLGEEPGDASGALHWPLFNNLKVSLNGPPHLAVALKELFSGLSGQKVIVLGKPGDWYTESLGKEPELVFPTTLATLATDPDRKRQLWRLIKPLKA